MVAPVRSNLVDLDALTNHLARLDHGAALAVVDRARADGSSVEAVVTGLLAPALVEVGRRWASGEVGAAEALAAAAIARAAIPRAVVPANHEGRAGVAVCCPPGEHHEIPAEMVTELLRAEGVPVMHIGAGVTPRHLHGFLSRQQPAALLVSCTSPCGLPGTARLIEVAHAYGVPVLVGGAAFGRDPMLALRLGAAAWAPSARHAVGIVEQWLVQKPTFPTERALCEEYLIYEAGLSEIRARVVQSLRRIADDGDDPDGVADAQDRLELLLRHLGAALLVDDGRLFLDFLSWRAEYYTHRNIGPSRLVNALAAVSEALPSQLSRAQRFVDEGRQHLSWLVRSGSSEMDWGVGRFSPADEMPIGLAVAGEEQVVGGEPSPLAALSLLSLPPGSLLTGTLPTGSLPTGSLPTGSLPTGSLPPGSPPTGSLPTASLASPGAAVVPFARSSPSVAPLGTVPSAAYLPEGRVVAPGLVRTTPMAGPPGPVGPLPAPPLRADGAPGSPTASVAQDQRGRVFADLLFVAATTCHAPFALISVAQGDGKWSTLGHGVERRDLLADDRLLAAVGRSLEPLQISDLSKHPELGSGPLARGPLGIRFVYGIPLRNRQSTLLGVLCILDRRPRDLSARERQALSAVARQVAGQLAMWRRDGAASAPVPTMRPVPTPVPMLAAVGAAAAAPAERGFGSAPTMSPVLQPAPAPSPDHRSMSERLGLHLHRDAGDELLRSHEVAVLFDVTDRTVINWAAANKLPSIRTAGGHLRFRGEDVLALLAGRPLSGPRTA
jgi:excisionase family DNA binding protein